MTLGRVIRAVVATLVVAALTFAPLGPAAAQRPSGSGASEMTMPAGMPCCPDEHQTDGCKDCPLLALCMLKTVMADHAVAGIVIRLADHTRLAALDDPALVGLDRPPPDHPPRNLI